MTPLEKATAALLTIPQGTAMRPHGAFCAMLARRALEAVAEDVARAMCEWDQGENSLPFAETPGAIAAAREALGLDPPK